MEQIIANLLNDFERGRMSRRQLVQTLAAGLTAATAAPALLLHTVTFDPAEAADKSNIKLPTGVQPFGSADLSEDGTFTHTFTQKGIYTYVCKYHESMGMKGTVVVS